MQPHLELVLPPRGRAWHAQDHQRLSSSDQKRVDCAGCAVFNLAVGLPLVGRPGQAVITLVLGLVVSLIVGLAVGWAASLVVSLVVDLAVRRAASLIVGLVVGLAVRWAGSLIRCLAVGLVVGLVVSLDVGWVAILQLRAVAGFGVLAGFRVLATALLCLSGMANREGACH